jgi:hypothetical protein
VNFFNIAGSVKVVNFGKNNFLTCGSKLGSTFLNRKVSFINSPYEILINPTEWTKYYEFKNDEYTKKITNTSSNIIFILRNPEERICSSINHLLFRKKNIEYGKFFNNYKNYINYVNLFIENENNYWRDFHMALYHYPLMILLQKYEFNSNCTFIKINQLDKLYYERILPIKKDALYWVDISGDEEIDDSDRNTQTFQWKFSPFDLSKKSRNKLERYLELEMEGYRYIENKFKNYF